MHELRSPESAPGGSRSVRLLSWLVWAADFRGLWARMKAHLAVLGLLLPVAGLVAASAEITRPHAEDLAAWALLAGASFVGLLAWVRFIAMPLVTRGELPGGQNLADVAARRRMLWQLARDRRKALRHGANSAGNQGPHSHRRQQR